MKRRSGQRVEAIKNYFNSMKKLIIAILFVKLFALVALAQTTSLIGSVTVTISSFDPRSWEKNATLIDETHPDKEPVYIPGMMYSGPSTEIVWHNGKKYRIEYGSELEKIAMREALEEIVHQHERRFSIGHSLDDEGMVALVDNQKHVQYIVIMPFILDGCESKEAIISGPQPIPKK